MSGLMCYNIKQVKTNVEHASALLYLFKDVCG